MTRAFHSRAAVSRCSGRRRHTRRTQHNASITCAMPRSVSRKRAPYDIRPRTARSRSTAVVDCNTGLHRSKRPCRQEYRRTHRGSFALCDALRQAARRMRQTAGIDAGLAKSSGRSLAWASRKNPFASSGTPRACARSRLWPSMPDSARRGPRRCGWSHRDGFDDFDGQPLSLAPHERAIGGS